MLSFLGRSQTFCDGLSRRNFLQLGAFGAGLTLADTLRIQAAAKKTNRVSSTSAPKSAIMIYLPPRRGWRSGSVGTDWPTRR